MVNKSSDSTTSDPTKANITNRGIRCINRMQKREGKKCPGIDAGNDQNLIDSPGGGDPASQLSPGLEEGLYIGVAGVGGLVLGGTVGSILDSPALIGLLGLGAGSLIGWAVYKGKDRQDAVDNTIGACKANKEQHIACNFSNSKLLFKNRNTASTPSDISRRITAGDTALKAFGSGHVIINKNGRYKEHATMVDQSIWAAQNQTGITYPQSRKQKHDLKRQARKDHKDTRALRRAAKNDPAFTKNYDYAQIHVYDMCIRQWFAHASYASNDNLVQWQKQWQIYPTPEDLYGYFGANWKRNYDHASDRAQPGYQHFQDLANAWLSSKGYQTVPYPPDSK